MSEAVRVARWRCETCKGELTMPAGFGEWGYFCCYASMTFLGVAIDRDSGSDPQGENSRSEVEGEASQSGGAAASPIFSSRNPETPNDR